MWMHMQLSYLSINGYVGYFYLLATINNAVMSIVLHLIFKIISLSLSKYLEVELLKKYVVLFKKIKSGSPLAVVRSNI